MADLEWYQIEETEKAGWKFRFMLWSALHLPRRIVECIVAVVVFFFYLGAAPVRERSRVYLSRVFAVKGKRMPPFAVYRHILSFAFSMIEKIRGWSGKMSFGEIEKRDDDREELENLLASGKGAFVICSHLGNIEALRALTENHGKFSKRNCRVYPVVNYSKSGHFCAMLKELNPDWMRNCIDANSVGADTAIAMSEKIAAGNLVAIAGDRTSANNRERFVTKKFLGEDAEFPEGAFALANILKAPVYFIFAFRKKDLDLASTYELHVVRAQTPVSGPHREMPQRMDGLANEFVELLERYCLLHPWQWYNFYNFWKKGKSV